MNAADLFEEVIAKSSMFLFENTGSKNLGEIWFCNDSAAQGSRIRAADLVSPEDAERFLECFLEGGPSWIHVAIIKSRLLSPRNKRGSKSWKFESKRKPKPVRETNKS